MTRWHYLLLLVASCPAAGGIAADAPQVDFAHDVQSILENACCKCHGREKQQGGVRFDRRESAFGEGDSGERAITPGRVAASELIRRIEATDESERMPQNAP